MPERSVFAAVDLGSNSFRMEVGRVTGTQIYTLDALREPVRLASGLTKDKTLEPDAFARGLATLERFGERLRGFDKRQVRAVATNTLRVARNAKEFLREGERLLGFPIEVIAGREEARLIYFGVAHLLAPGPARRLVVDIGGGSTELVIGTGYKPEILESIYTGCVSASMQFFRGDIYDKVAFKEAELAARHLIEPVARPMREAGWSEVIGSSGTARALADLLESNGFTDRGITAAGLDLLRTAMIKAGRGSALRLEGLKGDRLPVLAGGLAIMSAVFAELGIERLSVSDGALRTGVLYELMGRATHEEDMREATVLEFTKRYGVDSSHANQVAGLALTLWQNLVAARKGKADAPTDDSVEGDDPVRLLRFAGALHEIGLSISHNGYHKHSAYILSNADMPGFSKREQSALAAVVLGHTGKLPKMRDLIEAEDDWRLVLCLRVAATLLRSRNYKIAPPVTLRAEKKHYALCMPRAWLDANPLTEFDLRTEVDEWRRIGKALEIAPQ